MPWHDQRAEAGDGGSGAADGGSGAAADLFAEARRQLDVCNACRYCEGYCPVWPALSLLPEPGRGDIAHLANLCHDCRDCFTACMYVPPHEFALNPPQLFARVRERTYRSYLWPGAVGSHRSARAGAAVVTGVVLVTVALAGLSRLVGGERVAAGAVAGSPYAVLPHGLLLALVGLPTLWTLAVLAAGAARYWQDTHGRLADLLRVRAWARAVVDGVQLRHLRGAGDPCAYPQQQPGSARRRLHLAVTYGFGLCMVSTASAAVLQDGLGVAPPYPLLSVPVVTGTAGGVALLAGCAGLALLKRDGDADLTTPSTRRADYGLLWALLALSGTGLLTLALRGGALFAPVLLVHLATVTVAVLVAPYTKFVHWIFRLLALYKARLDGARRP